MTVLRAFDRLWFAPMPAERVAVLRILVGAFALVYLLPRYEMLNEIAAADPALYQPAGVAAAFPAPLPPEVFRAVVIATLAANVGFLLGLGFRVTGPAFGILLLFVLCYRNSWSMIYHSDNPLVLHALILGFAPAADALSADAVLRRRAAPAADWRYGWPVKLMCAVTVISYFLCGVAKVAGPLGWGWATGESLRSQVAVDAFRKELLGSGSPPPLFMAVYEYDWLFGVMAAGSLALELGAPLALLDRRAGWAWAVSVLLMHWGIYIIMSITFRYQLSGLIFASFFPVERLVAWVRVRGAGRAAEPARDESPPWDRGSPAGNLG